MNKKGDYKYGLLFTLIMGVLVVGLSFYFIFNELFSEEDVSYEVCRQSVIARSVLPEFTIKKFTTLESFKDAYPLKCETREIEISEADVRDMEAAQRKIAETMMECWATFDKGDSSAFPSPGLWTLFTTAKTACVPCARIVLSEDAKDYMKSSGKVIDIRAGLDWNVEGEEFSYYNWLISSGESFSPFDLADSSEFNLSAKEFYVDSKDQTKAIFKNKKTGAIDDGSGIFFDVEVSKVGLPRNFNAVDGDLLIGYGIITSSSDGNIGKYVPYLFYFQVGQEDVFKEAQKELIDGSTFSDAKFCNEWEGVPV